MVRGVQCGTSNLSYKHGNEYSTPPNKANHIVMNGHMGLHAVVTGVFAIASSRARVVLIIV